MLAMQPIRSGNDVKSRQVASRHSNTGDQAAQHARTQGGMHVVRTASVYRRVHKHMQQDKGIFAKQELEEEGNCFFSFLQHDHTLAIPLREEPQIARGALPEPACAP
jgi:hypothetical protein